MKLYNIYWNDGCGNTDHIATTNKLDKWLEDNNKERIENGLESESLDDFQIEEADLYFYEEKKNEYIKYRKSYKYNR